MSLAISRVALVLAMHTLCVHALFAFAQPVQSPAPSAREAYDSAAAFLKSSQFAAALRLLEPAYARSVRDHDRRSELALLSMIGTAQIGLYRHRDAVATLTKAAVLAGELKRPEAAAAVATNLSDLYARLGQIDLAYAEAARAFDQLPASAPSYYRAQLLLTMAEVKFASGDTEAAISRARSGVTEARTAGDPLVLAENLRRLGNIYLRAGRLQDADQALGESFRTKLQYNARDLTGVCRYLGKLRVAQGKYSEALLMFDTAIEGFEAGRGRVAGWRLYYDRGSAKLVLGQNDSAFADFETAIALARRWRAGMLSLDDVLTQADVDVDELTSAYIESGMQRYRRAPDAALAVRLFTVCEDGRAMSLRHSRGWIERLPARYTRVLAEARSLEIAAFDGGAARDSARLLRLRADLARMETEAGIGLPEEKSEKRDEQAALRTFRRYLGGKEALISFFLGDRHSYVWALTNNTFEVHSIETRQLLARLADTYRSALLDGRDSSASAAELFQALFGDLSKRVRQSSAWVLSVEDVLFDVPFAALRDGSRFLIEQHALRIIPSAFMLGPETGKRTAPTFLALADPVYNRADPRLKEVQPSAREQNWFASLWNSEPPPDAVTSLELPRIPSSAAEAHGCARVWSAGPSTVLAGPEVNRGRLAAELTRKPAVLHLALHVVPGPTAREQSAYIALGLDSGGKPDFLTPTDISRIRDAAPVVVMSGCSSGRGRALPGAGLTGLTRAWLLAGSRAVAASHWPTPDDSGAMFLSFYRHLSSARVRISSRECAEALRAAQLEMTRSGNKRAQPKYWAAFFVMGRN